VVLFHDRVTLDHVRKFWATLTKAKTLDVYDLSNNNAAKLFILKSLDKDLQSEVQLRMDPDDGAAVAWMRMRCLIQANSVQTYMQMKADRSFNTTQHSS